MAAHALQDGSTISPSRGSARAKALPICCDHAAAAGALAGAIADAGDSHRGVAGSLGVGHGRVGVFCQGDVKRSMGLHLVVRLCRKRPMVARALLARLALLIEAPRPSGRGLLEHVAAITREAGDVAARALEVLSDGTMDDDERQRVRRELVQARAAIDAALAEI